MRHTLSRLARHVLTTVALLAGFATVPAIAQGTSGRSGSSGSSGSSASSGTGMFMPGSGRSAIGLNIGRSEYRVGCGLLPGCDDGDRAISLYGQSMVTDMWGARLSLLDMGRIDRGGGSTRARGVDLSLIGRLPVANSFSIYGKLGTTYGRTSTSVAAGSGLAGGSENGFGLSYGAGLSWDFTPRLSAVLEFDSHDFRFAGGGRDPVRSTSLGLQWRY